MPRDEDEDLSAPLDLDDPQPAKPRPKAAAPRAAAPEAAPAAPTWGYCGVMHQFGELATAPGTVGVVRYVTSGVQYTPPPIAARWRSVPNEPGRFEYPWDGDPAKARTLRTLRSELERSARNGALNDRDHPLLRELDEVAAALLSTAGQLHQARWSLGLVQPESVVIKGKPGRREVVLTDLGFSWKGSYGSPPWEDVPGRPDWLDPLTPNRWLWDHEPVRQQFAEPESGVYPPTPPVSDVRVLGRLLAWLLAGQTSKDVPRVGGADGPPPAWAAIADAAAGRLPSAEAFADRLRDAPLSEYFAPHAVLEEPPPKKAGLGLAFVGLLLVAIAAGGAAAWYFLLREKPVETASGGGGTTEPEKKEPEKKEPEKKDPEEKEPEKKDPEPNDVFDEGLKDFDAAKDKGDVKGMFASLAKLAMNVPADKKAEYEARRAKAIANWTEQVNAAVKLGADPSRRLEVAAKLDQLEAELKAFLTAHPATDPDVKQKEQQCLDYVATFARQFGPPR